MRQRDRKSGFKMDEVDEQEIEEYYRNRYSFVVDTNMFAILFAQVQ